MKKLITMTSYIIWMQELSVEEIAELFGEKYHLRQPILFEDYARLLVTSLSLSMFIPCNEKGEPMEKPIIGESSLDSSSIPYSDQYQKALDKVLFEGWESITHFDYSGVVDKKKQQLWFRGNKMTMPVEGKTIEDLINSGIELTPTEACKKQIGL